MTATFTLPPGSEATAPPEWRGLARDEFTPWLNRVAAYLNNRKRKDLIRFEDDNDVTIHISSRADVSPEHLQIRCYDATGSELKFASAEPSKSGR